MSTNPFGAVPVLPVAIPVGVLLFVLLIVLLARGKKLTWPRAVTAAVVAVYAAGIFANTIFPIYLSPVDSGEPWTPKLALVPFYDYEVDDALMNIAVFVPLGVLIPLLMRRASWAKVVLTAVSVSLGIELAQLAAQAFFAGGHIADVNDLMWNTVGGVVGYAVYLLALRIPGLSSLVRLFRWADDSSARDASDSRLAVRATS
ncbi:VanZ family protein [Microbacterium oleivorans]|uniref:Glycopeptide antibiotics resistance protein n=1 Tax=Microbacterium oleivorans TaxID=273677 RepID=A0A031FU85_9MICO|nr:VanZ family protein [Microbacterium oleivorans]EZP27746.1 Glycopeptide antibiotics resistance protein [Microbacterium oleivorans]